jgi:adenosylcobinamide-GDP ribazoletransferase
MSDTEQNIHVEPHDILAAFSLLTRLPVPVDHERAGQRANAATWAYPLVGAAVGALSGLVYVIATALLIPSGLGAALALLTLIALTGAMHEDGLADCADGFWGGHTRERRLEIMKDSAIGAYGTVILIVFLLAQWSAFESLAFGKPILTFAAVGAISRLPMVLAMWVMPNARETGLSAGVGMPGAVSVQIACALTLILAVLLLGWVGIAVAAIGIASSVPVFLIANAKIGGQTGDVLGASQKCAELGALAAILAI